MKEKVTTFEKYFLYFFMYSVIGWCYEVFLEVVVYRWGFSNRGFLFGPYTPVYGFGAILFLVLLYPIKKNKVYIGKINVTPIVIFLGAMVIATAVELLTSGILDLVGSQPLWDYSNYAIHFQGRIALNPSIRFGIGGLLFLYILQPLFEKLVGLLSQKKLHIVFTILFGIMLLDLIVKIVNMI